MSLSEEGSLVFCILVQPGNRSNIFAGEYRRRKGEQIGDDAQMPAHLG